MPQFYILFYANYIILATQREGHGPMAPPKYAPDYGYTNAVTPVRSMFQVFLD